MKISMDMIRAGMSKAVAYAADKLPVALIGLGTVGVAVTVVKACKATPKANEELAKLKETPDEELEHPRVVEQGKIIAKNYWPTALMGVASIGCFIASHKMDMKKQAATAAAYSLCEKALDEYKEKTVEIAGPKKAEEIDTAIAHDHIVTYNLSNVPGTGPLWIIDFSKGAFRADRQVIEAGINKFNSDL